MFLIKETCIFGNVFFNGTERTRSNTTNEEKSFTFCTSIYLELKNLTKNKNICNSLFSDHHMYK